MKLSSGTTRLLGMATGLVIALGLLLLVQRHLPPTLTIVISAAIGGLAIALVVVAAIQLRRGK